MIKNERQYRITKAEASKFASALQRLEARSAGDVHPLLHKAQVDALRSQHAELEAAINEYEALQNERPAVIEAQTLDELPRALIRARIALGLSQKDLGERMKLKEQQIQRYEATEYASASLSRIHDVAKALGVRISERVFLPLQEPARDSLYARLESVGLDKDFLLERVLPTDISTGLESDDPNIQAQSASRASEVLHRLYGWEAREVYGSELLPFPDRSVATARFKIPGGPHGRRLQAYIVYAHYLAMVVANSCRGSSILPLSMEANSLRSALLQRSPDVDLHSILHFFWDHGVPVLPLGDAGAFHGACWRIDGRNVIVLKHRSKFFSRWVFDLLHEWFHAAQSPEEASHSWIEDSDLTSTRRTSPEEQAANNFAGNVLLNEAAEALVAACVKAARGSIPALKAVVPQVAERAGVVVDDLANYLAWRLSLQGENWWGTANNLQTKVGDPFSVACKVFYERFDFSRLDLIDAGLLASALGRGGVS